ALAFTVATVAAGAACFFMCHDELLRFRSFLGCGLSRCSIFCRRGLGGFSLRVGGLCRRFGLRSLLRLRGCGGRRSFCRSSLSLRVLGLGLLTPRRTDLYGMV